MAIASYDDLKSAVADWLNRQDLTDRIPDFIRLLEAQVQRKLRIRPMMLTTEITLTSGEDSITLPDNFLAIRELRMSRASDGQVIPISYAAPNELTNILARHPGTGTPQAYSPDRGTVEFAPVPETDYTIKLFYWRKLPALSASVTSNWLLEEHPDIYLYGALLQAEPYLKNDARVPLWSDALTALLEDIRVEDERATKAGVPLRMRFKPYG